MKVQKKPNFSPRDLPELFETKKKIKTGKSVAIIGGGVCGMAAARELSILGHEVSIFEKEGNLGGQMRNTIPKWRSVEHLLDKQVAFLKKNGVDINLNTKINKKEISKIIKKFDVVLVCVGATESRKSGIPGGNLGIQGIDFLKKAKKEKFNLKGKIVVVIGGGNTAIDASVTCKKSGAETILIYRRTGNEMPAFSHEIENAAKSGVQFKYLLSPEKIEKKDKKKNVVFSKTKIGEVGDDGRGTFVKTDEKISLLVDEVIFAIGEITDLSFLEGIEDKKVFLGGDAEYGPDNISSAVFDGRKTALEIDKYLGICSERKVFLGEGLCYDCGVCVSKCPTNAISRIGKEKYEVDYEKCIRCGLCERVCPGNVWLMK